MATTVLHFRDIFFFMKIFRKCVICGDRREQSLLRMTWKSRPQLALLLALLIHSDDIDVERAKAVLRSSTEMKKGKYYCREHSEKAMLLLVDEACTQFENLVDFEVYLEKALSNYPSRVVQIVPPELLHRLQCLTELFDKSIILSMQNIVHLISENVSRYGLNSVVRKACFDGKRLKRKVEICDGQASSSSVKSARLTVPEKRAATPIDEQTESLFDSKALPLTSNSTSLAGPSSSNTQACSGIAASFPECRPHSDSPLPRSAVHQCKQWNTDMCSEVFSIDGERLKMTFRFCTKCGARIEGDGCLSLSRIGAAPIATVCCSNCTRVTEVVS